MRIQVVTSHRFVWKYKNQKIWQIDCMNLEEQLQTKVQWSHSGRIITAKTTVPLKLLEESDSGYSLTNLCDVMPITSSFCVSVFSSVK